MAKRSLWRILGKFIHRHHRIESILDRSLRPVERVVKGPFFGCQMCGQCVLHSTGMVCPMTCPKDLRNGPCGGVAQDGSCEVVPDMTCVWVDAYQRSQRLLWPEELHDLKPPLNWSLHGTSSWINALTGLDQADHGCNGHPDSALDVVVRSAPETLSGRQ